MTTSCWRSVVVTAVLVMAAGCTSTPPTPSPTASATVTEPTAVPATAASSVPMTISPPTASPTANPTPTAIGGVFPATVLGLPVHKVSEAHALMASGAIDGRLIAVAGYWSQVAIPCPFAPHQSVMDGFCTGITFDDSDQRPSQQTCCDSAVIVAPETANGNLLWNSQTATTPGAVVVVGHADDSRSWQCRAEEVADCQRKLVLDRVAWVNGQAKDLGSPSSQLTLDRLRMTPEQAAAVGVKPGEQLLTAYPIQAYDMNDVDPRFMGIGTTPPYPQGPSPVVWYVRAATGAPDADGVSGGAARLVDDVTGDLLADLSLVVAADYRPARIVLDLAQGSNFEFAGPNFNPRGEIRSAGEPIFADYVGSSSTPAAVPAGQYLLHGFMGNEIGGGDSSDYNCDLAITVEAGTNVFYAGKFTKAGCSWAPSESQF